MFRKSSGYKLVNQKCYNKINALIPPVIAKPLLLYNKSPLTRDKLFDKISNEREVNYLTKLKLRHNQNMKGFKDEYILLCNKEMSLMKYSEKLVAN